MLKFCGAAFEGEGRDFNRRLNSRILRKLLEARVGIGPFLARFRLQNACFCWLIKHYSVTAPSVHCHCTFADVFADSGFELIPADGPKFHESQAAQIVSCSVSTDTNHLKRRAGSFWALFTLKLALAKRFHIIGPCPTLLSCSTPSMRVTRRRQINCCRWSITNYGSSLLSAWLMRRSAKRSSQTRWSMRRG